MARRKSGDPRLAELLVAYDEITKQTEALTQRYQKQRGRLHFQQCRIMADIVVRQYALGQKVLKEVDWAAMTAGLSTGKVVFPSRASRQRLVNSGYVSGDGVLWSSGEAAAKARLRRKR